MTRIPWRWSVLSLCVAAAATAADAPASPSDAPRGELAKDVIATVVQTHAPASK